VRIVGENLKNQKVVAEQIKDILNDTEGTNWIRTSYQDDYYGVKVDLKDDKANRLGITNALVSQTLGAGLKGFPVSTLYEGEKAVDILLRFDEENRGDFKNLGDLHISSQFGTKVPLREIAAIVPEWHNGNITHRNGLRTLTVITETQMGLKAATVQSAIMPKIAALELPEGISINYGGEYENTNETAPYMMASLGVSLVLIFLVLLFQFKNFTKVLIVLSTFPLSLLGAFLGLLITGNPIGFTAFMGIISLIGIVVRNGIILVDYADELVRDHGFSIKEAALASGKRRMRPIFLTSAAAAIGVVPMIVSKSPLWAPLGSVLAVGLIVSMVFTLFIVPILYFKFMKKEEPNETPDTEVSGNIAAIGHQDKVQLAVAESIDS